MHLEKASEHAPPNLAQLLRELGGGESGFGGTSFGEGTASLDEFLKLCRDGENPALVHGDFVPQTIFWMIDKRGDAVGMVRVRHHLNERLLQSGGHVGYYVRPSERQKGYATKALRLAIEHLKTIGVLKVLVTVSPANDASIRVALVNGGSLDGQGRNPHTGEVVNRYWIDPEKIKLAVE
jgi:predicted acetyltransferase